MAGKRSASRRWRAGTTQSAAWHEAGILSIPLAVNVSALQFRTGKLAEIVTRAIAETGAVAGCLEHEVTENAIVDNLDSVNEELWWLQTASKPRLGFPPRWAKPAMESKVSISAAPCPLMGSLRGGRSTGGNPGRYNRPIGASALPERYGPALTRMEYVPAMVGKNLPQSWKTEVMPLATAAIHNGQPDRLRQNIERRRPALR